MLVCTGATREDEERPGEVGETADRDPGREQEAAGSTAKSILTCSARLLISVCLVFQAKEEVAELQKQLTNYERDKVSLAVSS